jgi:hypothetical protein
MEVSNVSAADPTVAPAASSEAKIARLQMALLRKTLDAQQEQSAELMRMMEGKGQVVDLRV